MTRLEKVMFTADRTTVSWSTRK